MKKLKYIIFTILLCTAFTGMAQQPFKPGNIVVYRVGDGSGTLAAAGTFYKVFLDEYTPSGTLVQTIAMPSVGTQKINVFGGNTFGYMTLSTNGKYLVVPGYDRNLGPTNPGGKSIGLVDHNGAISSITVLPNPNAVQPVSAVSDNGSNLWLAGGSGTPGGADVEYTTAGSSTSVNVFTNSSSTSAITIADGQLYIAQSGGDLQKIGTGLPITTGQSSTSLPGIGNINARGQFAFVDLNPAVAGMDVLYVCSQLTDGLGGLHKYSLVSGNWVFNGSITTTPPGTPNDNDRYGGLTIKVSGNSVTIFATRAGSNDNTLSGIQGGQLVSLTDNSGYNGTLTGTPTILADMLTRFGANDVAAFRGVALVPQPEPYKPGNIVVYRVGDGSGTLAAAGTFYKVFLDEYTPSGTLVQTIAMPSVGTQKINVFGGNTFGYMTLSTNGKYLVVPGYDRNLGPTNPGGKSIGLVDHNGAISSITVLPNPNAVQPVSAVSDNGSNLWLAGGSGTPGGADVEYTTAGSSTSVNVFTNSSSTSAITIADGQLYIAQSGGDLQKIGTGLPITTGQSSTSLPGIGNINARGQFAFVDLNPAVAGMDVLYVCSQLTDGLGGLHKYSLVSGNWVFNGSITTTPPGTPNDNDRYGGLTIKVSGNSVTIFATRAGSNDNTLSGIQGGQLVSLTDNSGYNGTLTGTPTILADMLTRFGANDVAAFRGVALVPQGCKAVGNLQAINVTSSQATITWTATNGETNFEYAVTTSSLPPASGIATTIPSVTIAGLTNAVTYYAHVRTNCSLSPSEWSTVSFTTSCKPPSAPFLNIGISGTGVTTIKWNQVFGAASYEYAISTSNIPPASGTSLADTSVVLTNLSAITTYYIHVRSNCGSGAFSVWTTKSFTTGCFMPALAVSISINKGEVKWNKVNNAAKYEYALTHTISKPLSGTYTTDTMYLSSHRHEGSLNYFHVRSVCSNGALSEWSTIDFTIQGLQVYPNPVGEFLNINLFKINNPSGMITVTDAMGRIMKKIQMSTTSTVIDTRRWASGIYLVRYYDGQNKYTVTVLK